MRYSDASHVDVGSFYARLPAHGKMFRLLGHAAVVAAVVLAHDPRRVAILLVVLVLAWLLAWYRVVGTLWRSSLVSAIIACAAILTLAACRCACAAPTSAPASP